MTRALDKAAAATAREVVRRATHQLRVIPEMTKGQVAAVTQNAAQATCRMAMIDRHPFLAVVTLAKVALGLTRDRRRLIIGDAELAGNHQLMLVCRPVSIAPAIPFPARFAMLAAILTHPRILAFPTPGFAKALGDIVKAKVAQRQCPATNRACFVLHSIFHNISSSEIKA